MRRGPLAVGGAVFALSLLASLVRAANPFEGWSSPEADDVGCETILRDLDLDPEAALGADRIREMAEQVLGLDEIRDMALALGESDRETLAEALVDSLPWQPKE